MSELVFFIGKGGVGKTTVSAAFAAHSALQSPRGRVLLISTDPAHSLGDVLQRKLGARPDKIRLTHTGSFAAWEMDAAKLFRGFLDEHRQELVEAIERGSLFTAGEISELLDTALPGMSEMAALLALQDAMASRRYARIVVDTAPFGHTLRLFGLPDQFLRLLNFLELSAERDRVLAQHFGGSIAAAGTTFINEWREKVDQLRKAFTEASLFLVTTAEKFALNESFRCLEELERSGLKLRSIVLNRVVSLPGRCGICRGNAQSARAARKLLGAKFKNTAIYLAEDMGNPVLGVEGLREFAAHVFGGRRLKKFAGVPPSKASFALEPARWPRLGAPLTFVLGKGGVGKTTVSAGLAFSWRERRGGPVDICSVDPAPSLDDIFQAPVADRPQPVLGDQDLRASEFDSVAMFRRWMSELRAEVEASTSGEYSGIHVDLSYERRLFSELLEVVPPGLDEVLAIFRIVELAGGSRRVIIDMAPTGHALELLRMPERILVWTRLLLKSLAAHRKLALAREAAVKIAELEVQARELAQALKNSRKAALFAVMLAEPLPDRETEDLLRELKRIGLFANALFVNRVLMPEEAANCRRCMRTAQGQARVLAGLKKSIRGTEIYLIRNFGHEVAGKDGLRELTQELWRLQ